MACAPQPGLRLLVAADERHLQDTSAYLVRNPLSLQKLVYLDGERAVIYRSRMNPILGRKPRGEQAGDEVWRGPGA